MNFIITTFSIYSLFAGPVGNYLGIYERKWGVDTFSFYDSIHNYLSGTYEIILNNGLEYDSVAKETLRAGKIAYVFKTSSALSPDPRVDTLYEEDTLLFKITSFLDTIITERIYRVPFMVNLFWTTGTRGFRGIFDLDEEGIRNDTLSILADSCRVIGIENVVVPYGFIPNAYKIRYDGVMRVGGVYMGYSWRDTIYIRSIVWYKDSLWLVKDSAFITERLWFNVPPWMLLAFRRGIYRVWLTDLPVAIEEMKPKTINGKGVSFNIITSDKLTIDLPPGSYNVTMLNALGQVIFTKSVQDKFVWETKNLGSGVYRLKITNRKNGEAKLYRVIKL